MRLAGRRASVVVSRDMGATRRPASSPGGRGEPTLLPSTSAPTLSACGPTAGISGCCFCRCGHTGSRRSSRWPQPSDVYLARDEDAAGGDRVISNGVADDPPVRDRTQLRAELGAPPGAFLRALVAALRPEKQATVFVEQVAAAHAAEPAVRGLGLVVGHGPYV